MGSRLSLAAFLALVGSVLSIDMSFRGPYLGYCPKGLKGDGLYIHDHASYYICRAGQILYQPCAPGTRHRHTQIVDLISGKYDKHKFTAANLFGLCDLAEPQGGFVAIPQHKPPPAPVVSKPAPVVHKPLKVFPHVHKPVHKLPLKVSPHHAKEAAPVHPAPELPVHQAPLPQKAPAAPVAPEAPPAPAEPPVPEAPEVPIQPTIKVPLIIPPKFHFVHHLIPNYQFH